MRWPAFLVVLHLKRWEVITYVPFIQRKVSTEVKDETLLVVDAQQPAYRLRGVVRHRGDAGGGHYTSTVRAPNSIWYFCNDEVSLRRITTADALRTAPTIFVYERY